MTQCKETSGSIQCVLDNNHHGAHENTDGHFKWFNHERANEDQGWMTFGVVHKSREETFKYNTGKWPKDYKCSECNVQGCKLWRPYNSSNVQLYCGECALKDQKEIGPIDEQGYHICDDMKCDQIGWLVPAIPCEDEDTYWGYSSVPSDGVNWWRKLPTKL